MGENMSDNFDNNAPSREGDQEPIPTDPQETAPPPLPEPPCDDQEESEHHRFSLSETNLLYFGIVAVLSAAKFFMENDGVTSIQFARFAGGTSAFILFPTLVAWLYWGGSGKKKHGGSKAFNITLTLMLIGLLYQYLTKR
ncbi:MAG: hypothetical protein ISS69_06475 [Phycisphaerae bacterium]|nr:hypothetical protein [Phycisphaerae bacterium]